MPFPAPFPVLFGAATAAALTGTATDAVAIVDSVGIALTRVVTDSVAASDSQSFDRSVTIADSVAAADSAPTTVGAEAVVTDTVALTDTAGTTQGTSVTVTDPVAVLDSVQTSGSLGLSSGVTEAVAIVDTASPGLDRIVTVTDAAGIQDTTSPAIVLPILRTVTDTVTVTDSAAGSDGKFPIPVGALLVVLEPTTLLVVIGEGGDPVPYHVGDLEPPLTLEVRTEPGGPGLVVSGRTVDVTLRRPDGTKATRAATVASQVTTPGRVSLTLQSTDLTLPGKYLAEVEFDAASRPQTVGPVAFDVLPPL